MGWPLYILRESTSCSTTPSLHSVGLEVAHLMVDLATEVAHLGAPLPLTSGGFNITGTPRCATSYILRQLRKWPRAKATTIFKGSHRAKISCHERLRLWGDALRHVKNWFVLSAKTMNMVIIRCPARRYTSRCCHSRTINMQIP